MPVKVVIDALTSLATALGANAVPALGVFVAGWQPQTAMLLYAFETMLAVALVALRIRLLAPAHEIVEGRGVLNRSSILRAFLTFSLSFAGGAIIFLVAFLWLSGQTDLSLDGLRTGATAIVIITLWFFIPFVLLKTLVDVARPIEVVVKRAQLGRSPAPSP